MSERIAESGSQSLSIEYLATGPRRCEFFLRSLIHKNWTIRRYSASPHRETKNIIGHVYLRFGLHVIRPRLDARHVAMCILRVGRRHVRMAHLRTRVRMVRVMGRYVLNRRKGRLQLVVPDHLLSPVLPRRHFRDRLLRAVAFDRSFDLLLVSGNEAKCPDVP